MAWLYVPELEGWNSDSDSLNLTSELSVTWRGKPMQRRFWQRAWVKGGWIRRLFGMTSPPLMLARGVASWISSLAATHASRSAPLGGVGAQTIRDTSGHTSPVSSKSASPYRCSWKMLEGTSGSDSVILQIRFEAWATMLRRVCLQRRKSERRIDGKDCSSWPTAKTATGDYSYSRGDHNKPVMNLHGAAKAWTTPSARDHKDGADPSVAAPTNCLLGRQAPRSGIGGQASSQSGRRLNPLFVEWLMGWPLGWTDFAPVAMESFRLWQRTHTELLRSIWRD